MTCNQDGNPCTLHACYPEVGCVAVPVPNLCPDDGNPCTDDVCIDGVCMHPASPSGAWCPDDGNPCTQDFCEDEVCRHECATGCTPCPGGWCVACECVTVPPVDLQFGVVPEEDEEYPGGFVCLNDDDDDNNGVADMDDVDAEGVPVPVIGEDDLVMLTVTADGMLEGTLTLDAVAGGSRIRVYENPDRSGLVTLPRVWSLGGLPKSLVEVFYVEGVEASPSVRDVELLLFVDGPTGYCEDSVKLTVCEIHLKEVSFYGVGKYDLHRDTDGMLYSAPHWKDNSSPLDGDAEDEGDRQYPVAYVRASSMRAVARLVVAPTDAFGPQTRVRGDGPGGVDFEDVATLSGNVLTMTNTAAGEALGNTVNIFDPMEFVWSASADGGTTWVCGGVSRNPVYVVLNAPVFLFGENRYHTLFRNSCRDAAGAMIPEQVLTGVWSDFPDRVVMRADPDANGDPVQLTYYANWECTSLYTSGLLSTGDGQCGAWARFFLDMLRAHGITYVHQEYVTLYHHTPGDDDLGFLVNDWEFSDDEGISGDPDYPYLNFVPEGVIAPWIMDNTYIWQYADVNDVPGVPGQGTSDPASFFNNHQTVLTWKYLYDPSYGNAFISVQAFENQVVAGFYRFNILPVDESVVQIDLNGDGDFDDVELYRVVTIRRNDPTTVELVPVTADYP